MNTSRCTRSARLFSYLALASLIYPAWASVAQAQQPQLVPQAGVLVLRTGRVLSGDILPEGDRFIVGLNEQDQVAIPRQLVEFHCRTLTDAYRCKRAQLPRMPRSADHLALADWCLRYDLWDGAAEQLCASQRCDPANAANERFEKRLRLAMRPPSETAPRIQNKMTTPFVSQAELDAVQQSFPPGAVEEFTSAIQPLLINSCGSNGCHGTSAKSEFRLYYPTGSRLLPRRFTQRNLQSVRELLDRDEPDQSPLLKLATARHGNAPKAPIAEDDVDQLQLLAGWVYRSVASTDTTPAVVKEPDTLLLQPIRQPGVTPSVDANASTAERPAAYDPLQNLIDPSVKPASFQEAPERPGSGPYRGVDPFDPEIFNRRYAPAGR